MSARDGKPCVRCGANDWNSRGACLNCKRQYNHRYYQENKETFKEKGRIWQGNNKEKTREYNRRSRASHPERANESQRRYREANRAKTAAAVRKWEKANPERAKERAKRYQKKHPEVAVANSHRRRVKKKGNGGSYTVSEWKDLCNYYSNRCLRCGRDDVKLTVDHVLPIELGGRNDIENLQPLCKSCNSWKGARNIDYRQSRLRRWIQKVLFD